MSDILSDEQRKAVDKMSNGCILNGDVGSGKSRTGLYYYFKEQGGSFINGKYVDMVNPKDLYIITTAKKRDNLEWDMELSLYLMSVDKENSHYKNMNIIVDSWNNIKKYKDVKDAFFIFDEDKVTGNGVWVKTFLKLTKHNDWIILSATPGDTWEDYIPVFIANGFYRNRNEFTSQHIVYARWCKFPKIDKWLDVDILVHYRNKILVTMNVPRSTVRHDINIYTYYNKGLYKSTLKNRWDPYKNEPIQQASTLCYILRRIVNEDESRISAMLEILENVDKAIIFYNFDYELDMLRRVFSDCDCYDEIMNPDSLVYEVAEWNGHNHQPVPDSKRWVYLVQYNAGCEGWNCIKTDTIIFFSQNYSYKTLEQAKGRIDRMNTPFVDLYYYHIKSHASIDAAISKAIENKKLFNAKSYAEKMVK